MTKKVIEQLNEKWSVGLLALLAGDPARAVGGDAASRDDGMDVGMVEDCHTIP